MILEEPTITEVEGVPAVVGNEPGPLRATLMVRVGTADETVPVSGITHLLEHLALFGLGRPGEHSNGSTDAAVTSFYTVGEPAEVAGFLSGVTRQLHRPPVERLAAERELLRAEKASRRRNLEENLRLWRYGARGFGITALGEPGLPNLDAEAVEGWAARYATRANSVLWFSSPPPAGITLHLPDGERRPAPDPRASVLPELPAWYAVDDDGIGLFAIVDRVVAGPALAHLLHNRMVDELRTRRAVAYSPGADYAPLTGEAARLLIISDLVSGRQSDGVRPVLAALGELADSAPPTEEELASWAAARARSYSEPFAALGHVVATAWNLLFGARVQTIAELTAEQEAMTAEDVQKTAAQALASAVAAVPEGVRVHREPWRPAPSVPVREPVTGVRHQELGGAGVLEVADDGITLHQGSQNLTVLRDDAVAVRRWPDGRRAVIASDATNLVVEPTLWADGPRIVEAVDRLWPEPLWIPQSSRRPDEIPSPPEPPAEPPSPPSRSARPWLYAALIVVAFLAVIVIGATVAPSAIVPGLAGGLAAAIVTYRRARTNARR